MNLLFVDHAVQLGGAEHSLLDLLRTLDRQRYRPAVACPPGRLADEAKALGIAVVDLELEKLRSGNPLRRLARLQRGKARLRRVLDGGSYALVHANTLRAAVYASGVSRACGCRLAWHVRDYQMPSWARRLLLRRCDVAVAPSQFIASALGHGDKVRVVPNGVDVEAAPGEEAFQAFRKEFRIPPDAPVLGCLGRIRPWKGQSYFVDVAARVAARMPEARFLIVGSTLFPDPGRDYVAELEAEAQALGVGDKVVFTGHRTDPLAALGAMDVVANCSESEPFGRVLLEAMACRRPVVAFRSGAVPEIVVDGSTGLLVPFGDTGGMAEAVFDLLRNRTRAEAYGEAGRQRAISRFSLAASTRAIERIYAALVGGAS
ncbi:MAG: glycosyltransferase family 4 protein [Candidatus Brocadiia bacterium]